MWSGNGVKRHYTEEERPRWPMHNVEDAESHEGAAGPSPESASTVVEAGGADEHSGASSSEGGTWGERDVGGPVNQRMAMEDYEALRRDLTNLSRTRSGKSIRSAKSTGISRVQSRDSARRIQPTQTAQTAQTGRTTEDETDVDLEAGEAQEEHEEFELDEFMREGHFEKRKDGRSAKKVGVVFKNV